MGIRAMLYGPRDMLAQEQVFNAMIEARQRTEERLQIIFDASPDAQLISDAHGFIVQVNRQVEHLLGYIGDELIGQSIEVLVPSGARSSHPEMRRQFAAAAPVPRMGRGRETRALRKDGREVDVEISLSRIQTGQGELVVSALRDVSDRKRAEERINGLLAEQNLMFDNAHVGIVMLQQRRIIKCNQRQAEIFGYAGPQEIEGRATEVFFSSQEQFEQVGARLYTRMEQDGFVQGEMEMCRQDGSRLWIMVTGRALNPQAVQGGSIWVYTDITERRQAETERRIAATAFESREGMLVTDTAGVILRVNKAFTEITGFSAADVAGQTTRMLRAERHDARFYRVMWETVIQSGGWEGELWGRRKNAAAFQQWLTISAVKDESGLVTHYILTIIDITERKKAEDKIVELAYFDQLTGLPNRTLLQDRLKQAVTASVRSGQYGALLLIDLDNFKILNDTLGHDTGDELLKQVARRLANCVREIDTVARLGGDEFVIVLAALSASELEAVSGIETVAAKILAALNQPYLLGKVTYHCSASIGATLFCRLQTAIDDLLKQADLAMYKAKEVGRNALRFFDTAMQARAVERSAMEADLRIALEEGQLQLHYQAQVAEQGRITGVEALARWRHPRRGMVSPVDFIPLAEETGLIVPLGNWVLKTACTQLALWAARPEMAHLTMAINVSVYQFTQHDFVEQVLAIVNATGANPQRIKLELTESLLVEDLHEVAKKMFALKARGIAFSLDDFGTGYSSLSYLKRLPLDQLKIDRSFVREVLLDSNDAAIARTVVALAASLGMGVIAEGVESAAQQVFLTGIGCHYFQGFYFSQPLPIDGFETYARNTPHSNMT